MDATKIPEVIRYARAHIDEKYGPFPDDENWVSIEQVKHDADGWHVRGYIKSFGFVHVLVDDETTDLMQPPARDDFLAEE